MVKKDTKHPIEDMDSPCFKSKNLFGYLNFDHEWIYEDKDFRVCEKCDRYERLIRIHSYEGEDWRRA